jgi:serine/threonine protein kinase
MKKYMINEDFVIVKNIGKGAFSSVYKVRRVETEKIYALKQVPL